MTSGTTLIDLGRSPVGRPILLIGIVICGVLVLPLVSVLAVTRDRTEPKIPGHRVRQAIGVVIVAAAVWITFLNVSAQYDVFDVPAVQLGVRCSLRTTTQAGLLRWLIPARQARLGR